MKFTEYVKDNGIQLIVSLTCKVACIFIPLLLELEE